MEFEKILIVKNRGWRGLAEAQLWSFEKKKKLTMIFSFSQDVWDDMQKGYMVLQDENQYIVVHFTNTDILPKGQRSVLIKHFVGDIISVKCYPKTDNVWTRMALKDSTYEFISHSIQNKNNHTTSDWNCIGIRVVPKI